MKETIRNLNDCALVKGQVYEILSEYEYACVNGDNPKPIKIEIKYASRTISQNALYWMWLSEMAEYFSKKAGPFTKEEMHDLMRHTFLGYENKRIGNTEIAHQLLSTTDLNPLDMSQYLSRIDAWCADKGLLLKVPPSCDYSQYKEVQI